MQPDLSQLRVRVDDGIARVTIDNPPVNVMGVRLMTELSDVLTSLGQNKFVRVIVIDSAQPEFFVAHVDMTLGQDADAVTQLIARAPAGLNPFQALSEQLRHQPQVTIVKLAGKARGGGAELVAAADMAFAAIGRAGLGQVEALMGIVPSGGGTQYLDQRMGRSRALEVVLGADLLDAETAERYGWVNRALPADQLDAFVDRLAGNIAALPSGVVTAVKTVLPAKDLGPGMLRETTAWNELIARPAAQHLMSQSLARGAQSADGERDLEALLRSSSDTASGVPESVP